MEVFSYTESMPITYLDCPKCKNNMFICYGYIDEKDLNKKIICNVCETKYKITKIDREYITEIKEI